MCSMRLEPSKEKARYERLKMVGCGLVLVFMGVLRLRQGLDVVTHSTGQPMFSWGLIAVGVVCIILSLIPNSWVRVQLISGSPAVVRINGVNE